MQLCFGCLHTFPELTTVNFSTDLSAAFQALRSSVSKLDPQTSVQRDRIANIEDELRALFRHVKDEVALKEEKMETLASQVKYLSDQEEYLRRALSAATNAPKVTSKPVRPKGSKNTPPYASGLLHRFLVSSNMATAPRFNGQAFDLVNNESGNLPSAVQFTPSRTPAVKNRFGETISPALSPRQAMAGSAGRLHSGGVSKPVDLVAATLYSVVEALTVSVRGSVGILWLVGIDKDEALAPFVFDYGKRGTNTRTQSGSPFHVNLSNSMVGTVYSTGTAINVHNKTDLIDTNLIQQFGGTNHNSLFMPVFREFGRAKCLCFGVYQVIANKDVALPFNSQEEAVCAGGCAILSRIISNYQHFMPDWTHRVFDTSPLMKASYNSMEEAERSASQKGKSIVDRFVLPQSLVYRCCLVDPTTRITKQEVQQAHPGAIPMTEHLKEQHRNCETLETSWRNAVSAQAALEKKVESLMKELDLARQGLNDARKSLTTEARGFATSPKGETAETSSWKSDPNITPSSRILSNAEFENIESDTFGRMQDLQTHGHLTQRKGGNIDEAASFFVTQELAGVSSLSPQRPKGIVKKGIK